MPSNIKEPTKNVVQTPLNQTRLIENVFFIDVKVCFFRC